MAYRILIVEDDFKIVRTLGLYLEESGFNVIAVTRGDQALPAFRKEKPDLVLLDLNLPGIDGLQVCRDLRGISGIPIIMLTARVEEVDRLVGLEMGADDYIVKPFSPREVVARVQAVLRRASGEYAIPKSLRVGDIFLDLDSRQASMGGEDIQLTQSEFEILYALMRSPGRVYSRAQLLAKTQGTYYEGYERTIDQHIKNLRKKLTNASGKNVQVIEAVYGVGYRLITPKFASTGSTLYENQSQE
jgi:DNA-binding response OmpR family regulator